MKSGDTSSLYERNSASVRRTVQVRRTVTSPGSAPIAAPAILSFESVAEFSFNGSQAGVKQFPLRDQHQIHSRSRLVPTEDFSNQSLCSVPNHRAAELSGRGDAKPGDGKIIGQAEEREQPIVNPESVLVNLLVLDSTPNPLVRIQTLTA